MKILTKHCKLAKKSDKWYFYIEVPNNLIDKLNKLINKDCFKSIEIKEKKESRSLNSNAYAWTLINKIAIVMKSTDDEIYIEMLRKYGTKEYVACLPNIIPELKKAFKLVETISKTNINGKQGVTLRLIRGSSTYDTAEMSNLINGIVDDATLLQIDTLPPAELERIIKNWGI